MLAFSPRRYSELPMTASRKKLVAYKEKLSKGVETKSKKLQEARKK